MNVHACCVCVFIINYPLICLKNIESPERGTRAGLNVILINSNKAMCVICIIEVSQREKGRGLRAAIVEVVLLKLFPINVIFSAKL